MKRTPKYHYFILANTDEEDNIAYRATGKIERGEFHARRKPLMFTPEGWMTSGRYADVESFQASIDCGVLKRVCLLIACAAVNGDPVLFAPTLSSRLASKRT
jgi:hypothetical protein